MRTEVRLPPHLSQNTTGSCQLGRRRRRRGGDGGGDGGHGLPGARLPSARRRTSGEIADGSRIEMRALAGGSGGRPDRGDISWPGPKGCGAGDVTPGYQLSAGRGGEAGAPRRPGSEFRAESAPPARAAPQRVPDTPHGDTVPPPRSVTR